jgi:hypothetical protein
MKEKGKWRMLESNPSPWKACKPTEQSLLLPTEDTAKISEQDGAKRLHEREKQVENAGIESATLEGVRTN